MPRTIDLTSAYAKRDQAARHMATLVDFMNGVLNDPTRLATLGASFDQSTDRRSGEYVHQLDLLAKLNNYDKHMLLTELTLHANQFEHMATRTTLPPGWMEAEAGPEFSLEGALEPDAEDAEVEFSMDFTYAVGTPVMTLNAPAWPKSDLDLVGTAKPTLALTAGGRHAASTLERLHLYAGQVLDAIADAHHLDAAPAI